MGDICIFLRSDAPTPSVLSWVTTALSNGTQSAAYSVLLQATGGTLPYTFSLLSGSLPDGVSVNQQAGQWYVSGTPTTFGTFSVTLRVVDNASGVADRSFAFVIAQAPSTLTILTNTLPGTGTVGFGFGNTTFQAAGGSTPYTWSIVGTQPPGLTIGASTGIFGGTPTTAGTYTFNVKVTDNVAATDTSGSFTIVISAAALAIQTSAFSPGEVNAAWGNHSIVAVNGTPPYSFIISNKPAWMNYSSTGGNTNNVVSGTPTTETDYNLDTTVTDAASTTANRSIFLHIDAASTGEGRDDYFNELVADPDIVHSISLTQESQLLAATASTSQMHWHVPGSGPASWEALYADVTGDFPVPPGTYATAVKPPRRDYANYAHITSHPSYANISTNEALHIPLRLPLTPGASNPGIGAAGEKFVITIDVWWSSAFWVNRGPNPGGVAWCNAWKTFFIMNGTTQVDPSASWLCQHEVIATGGGNDPGLTGLLTRQHEGPIGSLSLAVSAQPPGFNNPPDGGNWAQRYAPTGSPDYPLTDTHPQYHDRWTRWWFFFRLDEPGANFTNWQSVTGANLTGTTWDMCSIASADEDHTATWLYYQVPTKRIATEQFLKRFWLNWGSSTDINNNVNNGLAGPIMLIARNFAVLRNKIDDTFDKRKPVR